MHHRGPDGAGYVIGNAVDRRHRLEDLSLENKRGRVALGHVRLAITGLASGLQPFQSEDGRVSFLHNGEIYNYRELWSQLGQAENARPRSDSEVVMQLLEQNYRGDLREAVTRILPKLHGVYALAISDQNQTVVIGSVSASFTSSVRTATWRSLRKRSRFGNCLAARLKSTASRRVTC